MRKQQSGTIINVTSIGGYMGLPFEEHFQLLKVHSWLWQRVYEWRSKNLELKYTLAPGDYATDVASEDIIPPFLKNSPYKKYAEGIKTMDEHVDKGNPPIEIAKAIYNILNNSNLKSTLSSWSYFTKVINILKKILPSQIFERLIMNHYKL